MGRTRWHTPGRDWPLSAPATDFLKGALEVEPSSDGWVRPQRFTAAQRRALGSCAAWHPALYRQMAVATAGVRLELRTDAQEVGLELWVDEEPSGTTAQVELADGGPSDDPHDGVSADVDGHHVGAMMPPAEPVELVVDLNDGVSAAPLPGMAPVRQVTVWLPCLRGCRIRRLWSDGSLMEPVAAGRSLLVVGDSIAQGFLAGDPAEAWPARVARDQGLDLLNQGLGGQVFQPTAMADLASHVDPELVWIGLGANYRFQRCGHSELVRDVHGVVDYVVRAWPGATVFVASPTCHDEEAYPSHPRSCWEAVPQVLAAEVARHPGMHLADGARLLEDRRRYYADADHPSLRGSRLMGLRIGRVLRGQPPIDTHEARALRIAEREGDAGRLRRRAEEAQGELELTEVEQSIAVDGEGLVPENVRPIDVDALGAHGGSPTVPIAPAVTRQAPGAAPSVSDLGRRGATARDIAALVDRIAAGPAWDRPVEQAIVRGLGEVVFASPGFAMVELPGGDALIWGEDAETALEVMATRPRPKMALFSSPALIDALGAVYEGVGEPEWHRIVAHDKDEPVALRTPIVVAPLGPQDLALVRDHYSHPEFFSDEQLAARLEEGRVFGGSLPDGRMVGFIGLHDEGSMGMLEVFPRHRRKGYGRDLEAWLINRHLERRELPWGEVFEENAPSLALQEDLGLVVGPAHRAGFIDCRPWEQLR